MIKRFKKGEVGTATIIGWILLILGFGILLYIFVTQIGWTGIVNKQTCHESVILRGTLFGQTAVPLKCRTDKICITSGFGGECKEYENAKGVTNIKVKDTTEIEKVVAENMVSCWKMMGEGKLSLFTQNFAQGLSIGFVEPRCVVCTRIAFDEESLEKKGINLVELDVTKYMLTRKYPGSNKSYAETLGELSGEGAGFDASSFKYRTGSYQQIDGQEVFQATNEEEYDLIPITDEEITAQRNNDQLQNQEMSIVFMQIAAPDHFDVFKNTIIAGGVSGAGVVGIAKFSGVSALSRGVKLVGKKVMSGPGLVIGLALLGAQQESVAWNRAAAAGYCGDVVAGDEAYDGCSVIRTANYDQSLNQFCKEFDNLP